MRFDFFLSGGGINSELAHSTSSLNISFKSRKTNKSSKTDLFAMQGHLQIVYL